SATRPTSVRAPRGAPPTRCTSTATSRRRIKLARKWSLECRERLRDFAVNSTTSPLPTTKHLDCWERRVGSWALRSWELTGNEAHGFPVLRQDPHPPHGLPQPAPLLM